MFFYVPGSMVFPFSAPPSPEPWLQVIIVLVNAARRVNNNTNDIENGFVVRPAP